MKKDQLQVKRDELNKLFSGVIKDVIPKDREKVGLYYSGGIDSSLISTYYDFKEQIFYNDLDYTERDFKKDIPQILKAMGGICEISFSPFGWFQLGKMAKNLGLEYVVSGECADELFGGYPRYLAEFGLNYQAQRMFPSYERMFPCEWDANTAGKRDFNGPLQILLKAERNIAKYFGLKIIFPFNDPRIRKFAWSLPPEMKIWNFENKVILRRLLEERDPNYEHFEKKGLYCSVNKWIGSDPMSYDKKDWIKYQKKVWKKMKDK